MRAVYMLVLALFWFGCAPLQSQPSASNDADMHAVSDNSEPKARHAFWIIAASNSPDASAASPLPADGKTIPALVE